jgi:hypothetical protein
MYPYGWPPPPPPPSRWPVTLLQVASVLVGVWIAGVTALGEGLTWLVADAIGATVGTVVPSFVWLVAAWFNAVLVALPAGILWALSRRYADQVPGTLAAARMWTLAAAVAAVVGIARVVPTPHNELLLALTAVLATGCALVLRRLTPRPARSGGSVLGLAVGLVALLPWLWAGSLGGLTETVTALAAAVAVGWVAAVLLRGGLDAFGRSRPWRVLVGGSAAGVALVPIGAVVGGTGVNLAEIVVLPPLGFAAAALPGGIALLIGAAAFGPIGFVDPEETSLLLGFSDVGMWTAVASALGVVAALVAGTVSGVAVRPDARPPRWVAATATLVVTVAAVAVYGLAGRPGFHGERLFVVMSEQADLSGLDRVADRTQRLEQTYRRLIDHAERTQAPLREQLRRYHLSFTPYYLVNAILVDGGPVVREWLSRRSDVDRVLLDQRLRPLPVTTPTTRGDPDPPTGGPQWNIKLIRADAAWRQLGATGRDIVIGTSDSGVDGNHPMLKDGFRGGDDSWYDPWNGTAVPTDHGGHGTHTIGSAVGRGGIGVAPDAQWVGCVNLDRNLGSPSRYVDCLQFMLAPFPRGGDPWRDGHPARAPHILTNSWGCPEVEGCDGTAVRQAMVAFHAAGVFFVAAAGNTGPSCESISDEPAPYPDVFTVGAVNRQRMVTDFSSRGPTPGGLTKPDVVAPGEDVLSSLPGGTYASYSGTSMATPQVAGVVALMWSANPRLIGDVDTTARILRETASEAIPSYASSNADDHCGAPANITGAGLVDAYAAVLAARPATP